MSKIGSSAKLLNAALKDLRAGKSDQAKRLSRIAAATTDPDLRAILSDECVRTGAQAQRIDDSVAITDTSENLWVAGTLDDAERDIALTQPGRLLDIALVGAVRKTKAAEIVSPETAIALAEALALTELHALAATNRAEEIDTDRRLWARLMSLTRASR